MDMMIPHTPFSLSHLLFSSLRHCPPPVRLAPTTRTRNGLSPSQEITPSLPVCMGGYYIADTDDDEDDNDGDDDMCVSPRIQSTPMSRNGCMLRWPVTHPLYSRADLGTLTYLAFPFAFAFALHPLLMGGCFG